MVYTNNLVFGIVSDSENCMVSWLRCPKLEFRITTALFSAKQKVSGTYNLGLPLSMISISTILSCIAFKINFLKFKGIYSLKQIAVLVGDNPAVNYKDSLSDILSYGMVIFLTSPWQKRAVFHYDGNSHLNAKPLILWFDNSNNIFPPWLHTK